MVMTPEQWLPILAKRLDDNRPRVQLLKSYMNGNAPLPEGGRNVRASWEAFQRDARTNWGQLILEAVTDRIVPRGILVEGDSQNDVALHAKRIWRDNRMDGVFQEWLRDGLAYGQSYLTCWSGDDGRVKIQANSPETMIVATDPLQPWRVLAALRAWRDINRGLDYALAYSEDGYQVFSRPSLETRDQGTVLKTLVQGKWDVDPSTPEPVVTGMAPPVVVYNNPGGVGEYEPHLDVINRINKGVLRRLTIEAMQAFRQRALKADKDSPGLQQKDADGNDIDWAKIFEPAPGALWDLPPGIDIWESQQSDTQWLLQGSKDDIRGLSAVTRTPLPILMPDNTNTSAAGAIASETGYISKCGTRLTEAKIGAEAVLVKALELEGVQGLDELTVSVEFEHVERVSMSERYQAAQAAKAAGESQKAIDRDILGKTPEQMRQDALDRAEEALRLASLMPQSPRNPVPPNVNDDSGTDRQR
jgi:hypothetical protein